MSKLLIVALMSLPMMAFSGEKHECHFAPENDMKIPVGALTGNGMTEEIFNSVLARIDKHYRPIIEVNGVRFDLQKDWSDDTVNAYAQQQGNTWLIKMFGGLARHEKVTADGFTMVACHELGHHLAGAPRRMAWASNEGQSDYFATTKCARRIWAEDDNVALMEARMASGKLKESEVKTANAKCNAVWKDGSDQDRALCLRAAMAGLSLGNTLADLGKQGETSFETPDASEVSRTNHQHPKGQCRTDTYYQGALCTVSHLENFDPKDPEVGACTRAKNNEIGLRPLCWYKPGGSTGGGDGGGGTCPFGDQSICDQLCQMNPSFPFCQK